MIPATVMNIKYKIDVNSGDQVPTDRLYKNEIAVCDISCADKIVFDHLPLYQAESSLLVLWMHNLLLYL